MYNFKITPDQGKDDTSTNRTSSSKPSGAPRSDKDFKRILSEKDKEQDEDDKESKNAKFSTALDGKTIEYEEIAYAQENIKKKQPSLFDLSKGKINKNANDKTNDIAENDVAEMASSDELPMESPNSIFKNLALKEKAGQSKKGEEKLERSTRKMGDFEAEEGKISSRFSQETTDLSYVNPLALNTAPIADIGQKLDKVNPSYKMTTQQLVDAIVKAISTVETQGKTDTVVTLKQPPMFAGTNVVLTSYETAKGEFNIRFENLTAQAQTFMDMQQNQESLRFALQQKGYAVHIIVATTQIESPQIAANPQQPSRDGSSQEQPQQQQQGRRPKEEKEEA